MTQDHPMTGIDAAAAAPARRRQERGSALIISMMIMVILTMLGVTFAVLAEQEEKISINSRDHEQTLYAAEAAVEIAKTWFNDPSTSTNLFKPADNQMRYTLRKGAVFATGYTNDDELLAAVSDTSAEVDGSAGSIYTGGALGGSSSRFDKPYRGTYGYGFWGRQATPDVLICGDTTLNVDGLGGADCDTTMKQYIDKLNRSLAMGTNLRNAGHSSRDVGIVEIEQIRVYRPPIDFNLNTRYGIATVEATAIKKVRNAVVARRTVREVLQEIPFPGPNGAIESEGEISAAGSAGVHWGTVVSSSTTDDITLPNSNANNFPDTSVARSTSSRWGFHYTINPAAYTDTLDSTTNASPTTTYLTEALGITRNGVAQGSYSPPGIGDPWLIFRARRRIIIGGQTVPNQVQPYPFTAGTAPTTVKNGPEFDKNSSRCWSHMFQSQIVRFPPMDYQTWKDVSQSGQNGMYYFAWDGSGGANSVNYKRDGRGAAQSWTAWLQQYDTGVFFFDTKDGVKPNVGQTNLTATHGWVSNMYVEGFIYLNSATFDSSGSGGGTTKECNMPGEVFLDDGIDLHASGNTTGDDCLCIRYDAEDGCVLGVRPIAFPGCTRNTAVDGDDCICPPAVLNTINASATEKAVASREAETYRNGVWDSDINNDGISDAGSDLTTLSGWSDFISANTGTNEGFSGGHGYAAGVLPGYPAGRRTAQGQVFSGARQDYMRDPRFLNHLGEAGWNASTGRQVHEPFLNFDSPSTNSTVATWANNHSLTVNYQAYDEPVEKNSGGAIVKRTTRARDATGALMALDLHINGVFYCEGVYTGTGNMKVYGSLLMRGGYAGTGSVDVWFNEDLVKGKFPPPSWKLPRVYASARDTN